MNLKKLQTKEILNLFSLFEKNNEQLFIVGGAVRNIVIGKEIKDIDFCTTATPQKMIEIFTNTKIIFDDKAQKFGTIKIKDSNDTYFEITTLREDIYKSSRFPSVKFIKDIKTDGKRRDFTMNALYMDKEGKIYDFFNGIEDIKSGTIKFIGNVNKSIKNDPLRILRYFRFCGEYFYKNFDEKTLDICLKNFDLTFTLTKKKFLEEYEKILNSEGEKIILDKWEKVGILERVNKFLKDVK